MTAEILRLQSTKAATKTANTVPSITEESVDTIDAALLELAAGASAWVALALLLCVVEEPIEPV